MRFSCTLKAYLFRPWVMRRKKKDQTCPQIIYPPLSSSPPPVCTPSFSTHSAILLLSESVSSMTAGGNFNAFQQPVNWWLRSLNRDPGLSCNCNQTGIVSCHEFLFNSWVGLIILVKDDFKRRKAKVIHIFLSFAYTLQSKRNPVCASEMKATPREKIFR